MPELVVNHLRTDGRDESWLPEGKTREPPESFLQGAASLIDRCGGLPRHLPDRDQRAVAGDSEAVQRPGEEPEEDQEDRAPRQGPADGPQPGTPEPVVSLPEVLRQTDRQGQEETRNEQDASVLRADGEARSARRQQQVRPGWGRQE